MPFALQSKPFSHVVRFWQRWVTCSKKLPSGKKVRSDTLNTFADMILMSPALAIVEVTQIERKTEMIIVVDLLNIFVSKRFISNDNSDANSVRNA